MPPFPSLPGEKKPVEQRRLASEVCPGGTRAVPAACVGGNCAVPPAALAEPWKPGTDVFKLR